MTDKAREESTKMLWGAMGFSLTGLFISGGMADGLTIIHLIIAIIMAALALVSTGFIWSWGTVGMNVSQYAGMEEAEKVKRDRIEQVLKNLSNDELIALKRRLSTGEIDDGVLYDYLVGDDGELVRRSS